MLKNLDSNLGIEWDLAGGHMISAMVLVEQAGIRMMKEYFEIEASKATPKYGFRKGLKLLGDKSYQATKDDVLICCL